MKNINRFFVGLSTLAVAAFTSSLHATTITYDDWVYNNADDSGAQISWNLTIDNDDEGVFTFELIIEGEPLGDISGFGFSTTLDDLDFGVGGDSILDYIVMATINGSVTSFESCNSATCNWGGTGVGPEYAFSVGGTSGNSDGSVTQLSFSIQDQGLGGSLDSSTFSPIIVRTRSIGGNEELSAKDYTLSGSVSSVPELDAASAPVSIAVLAGLLLLGFEQRRRKFKL